MISKHTILLYCKDYENIENYEQAINDETQTWICHHRLETHFSDGTERPRNAQLSRNELKALNMYYDRLPEELIFLTKSEHSILHNKGRKFSEDHRKKISNSLMNHKAWNKGMPFKEETRKKISEANKGKKRSEETRKKLSEATKRAMTEELRKKLSEANKGKPSPNKGKKMTEEQKKKIAEAHKGKHWKIVNGKRIYY